MLDYHVVFVENYENYENYVILKNLTICLSLISF